MFILLVYVYVLVCNILIVWNVCLDVVGDVDWVVGLDDDEIVIFDWLVEIFDVVVKVGVECVIGKVIVDYFVDILYWVCELDYYFSYLELEKVLMVNSGNVIICWKGMLWVNECYDLVCGIIGGEDIEFFLCLLCMGMCMVVVFKVMFSELVLLNW